MDSVDSLADSGENEERLIQAMKAYLDNDFVTAGTVLADVNKSLLDGQDAQSVYEFLLSKTKDTVENQIYEQAHIYYDDKDYMNAVTYFNKVLNLNPDSAEAWYYMGRSYQSLTDFEEARNCYRTIIEHYGDSEYVDEAQSYLDQIQDQTSAGQTAESES